MRRRPKVLITPEGVPWDGTVPEWAYTFRPTDWPGLHPWEQWDNWWEAAREWADSHMPNGFDELLSVMGEIPSRPWNQDDI